MDYFYIFWCLNIEILFHFVSVRNYPICRFLHYSLPVAVASSANCTHFRYYRMLLNWRIVNLGVSMMLDDLTKMSTTCLPVAAVSMWGLDALSCWHCLGWSRPKELWKKTHQVLLKLMFWTVFLKFLFLGGAESGVSSLDAEESPSSWVSPFTVRLWRVRVPRDFGEDILVATFQKQLLVASI